MNFKCNYLTLPLLVFSSLLSAQESKKTEDLKAIKAMCGCYEVEFNFAETFQLTKDSAYKPSETKYDKGLEWIELVEDSPTKVVMQHLLIVNDTMIIKHWRQDWQFENTSLYLYDKDNKWKYTVLPKNEVKGQWTQKVFQVDDSPRYEGSASWIHADDKHYWKNTTDAPLPRREHTKRKDYNVLKRTNIHEITAYGWLHEQDNDKINRDNHGNDVVLAKEKGLDYYRKVEDSKCLAAQNWWKENQRLWSTIRTKWKTVFDRKKDLVLEKSVDQKPLFMHLFALKPDASQEEIDPIFDRFVKK